MANRYWVGGTNTWNATAGSKWSTTSGGAGGSAVPTAADDVYIDANAGGNVSTVSGYNPVCRSLNFADGTGGAYTGTFTHATAGVVLSIGDGTAGAGNVALKFSSGMTLTTTGSNGSWTFVSTSATQQTVTTNGKSHTNSWQFSGVGSSYILGGAVASAHQIVLNNGIFDTGNFAMTLLSISVGAANTRTMTFGSSAITLTGASSVLIYGNSGGLTITANTAVVTFTGLVVSFNNLFVMGTINWNGLSIVINGGGQGVLHIGGATINNLTITGTANQANQYRLQGDFTCNTFTVNGDSVVNRPLVGSNTTGTPRRITAASTSLSNVDFRDITGAGAASWAITSGFIGNRLGNTNIATTTPLPTTMNTAGSTNDATKWSGGRVPLPQDDITISGSGAITFNNLIAGANVDMSAYTGTMTWTSNNNPYEIHGSVTLGSGMSWGSNPNTGYMHMYGRGTHTVASNGQPFFPAGSNGQAYFLAPGGSYSLQDAFSATTPIATIFGVFNGDFITNDYSMTIGRFVSNSSLARGLYLGTSIITMNATGALGILIANSTAMTKPTNNETWIIAGASVSTRTLDLSGMAIGTLNYTVAGSTGQLTATQSGYIDVLNFSDVTNTRTLAITSGQTLSVDTFNVNGTSGKLMTVKGLTGGSVGYLEILGAQSVSDYLSIQDIYSVIPNKFYAGTNSTDISGNKNIEFTATPTGPYITRRADVQVANATSATATFAYGLAPTAGRKIVAFYMGTTNVAGTITPPAGFTQIGTVQGTAPWITVWEGTSDGSQATLTFSKSGSAPAISGLKIYSIAGFTGTPTFDVSDFNSGTAITALNSAGSAPSNTANPALAIMVAAGSNTMGNSISATNGFGVMRDSIELTAIRAASKVLYSNAAVSSTYTWTTSRNAQSALVVFKDVAVSGAGNFFQFFN